jgi:hypothetical protein
MAALQLKDFSKPASAGPYAGSSRDDIFELKIKDERPFVIGTNKNGIYARGVLYDRKKKILSYYVGQNKKAIKEIRFSRIFKDADFGGGAGSGGGAEDTKITESLQCYYCSYVFNIKRGTCTSVSDQDLKKGEKYVNASETLRDCLKNSPWDAEVYIKTANRLYKSFGTKMKPPVYFHRDSRFMNNVYAAKAACHKIDKQSKTPQAPGSFSNDKWNPGDIWASTFKPSEKPLWEYVSNWGELNARVYQLAESGELLGISLKKIAATATEARITEFNSPKLQEKRKSYKYNKFTFGKTGDFFSSQDIYINTDQGDVQFRTFGSDTSWQGEIKGGSAAGGKIGGGNIHFYCKQVFGKGIYRDYDTEAGLLGWIKQNESNKKFQERMYELYEKHNSNSSPNKPLMKKEEFMVRLDNSDYKFKNSKMICLEFIDVLYSGNKLKRDEFTTKMFRYAQSDVDQSSYFVKLY